MVQRVDDHRCGGKSTAIGEMAVGVHCYTHMKSDHMLDAKARMHQVVCSDDAIHPDKGHDDSLGLDEMVGSCVAGIAQNDS